MIYDFPVFFEKNRVYRVYKGGALFDKFLDDGSTDGDYPEEWLASAVTALNTPPRKEREGVSVTKPDGLYFDDLVKMYSFEMLGDATSLGVLTKYLDSAIRLPVQAHPDKAFARKHFGSEHGKEESWLILETRPGACVYFGFKEGVSRADFEKAIDKTEEGNLDEIESLLCRYEVKKGDVIYIPANTVHAIGAGCLILEVQEPTDFTIQPERFCGKHRLSDREMYMELDRDTALDCFNYAPSTEVKIAPRLISESKGVLYEELIGKAQTESFSLRRITLEGGSFPADKPACVYVVLSGEGKISSGSYEAKLKKGDYFFLPHNAATYGKFCFEGHLEIAECRA